MEKFIGSINVDNGIRRVKVNEDGDFIQFSVNDSPFFDRFAEFLLWLESKDRELERFGEENKDADIRDASVISMLAKKRTETYRECCIRLDILFGEGCCRKVFGSGIVPDDLLIGDFIEQVTPIIEKLGRERNEKLSLKYNRNRKGANSGRPYALPGGHV